MPILSPYLSLVKIIFSEIFSPNSIIPRGLIEFAADDTTPLHNEALTKDKDIYLVCAAGGMAALAGKTLKDMGYDKVTNIGGISEWIDAGGDTE